MGGERWEVVHAMKRNWCVGGLFVCLFGNFFLMCCFTC